MSAWLEPIAVTVITAVIGAFLFWIFAPLRNRLESSRLRATSDHGVKLTVYVDPDEMEGLDLAGVLGVTTGLHPGVNWYFPLSAPPAPPPVSPESWWRWAKRHGGDEVYASHILLLLQATQDRAVTVGVPNVSREVQPEPPGIFCGPEGQGGNGLLVRRFYIDLDQPDPVKARFIDNDGVEGPRFTLSKGDSVAIVAIAEARSGRHLWRLGIPLTVDGQRFELTADNNGQPFVTVGPGSLRMYVAMDGEWL